MPNYGSAEGVAAIQKRHTNDGDFDATTNPTLTTVDNWLRQASSAIDAILTANDYTTPLDAGHALKPVLDAFANEVVGELVAKANGRGRFGPSSEGGDDVNPWATLMTDVGDFIERIAPTGRSVVKVAALTREDWIDES